MSDDFTFSWADAWRFVEYVLRFVSARALLGPDVPR
jgi:hypothetical protein